MARPTIPTAIKVCRGNPGQRAINIHEPKPPPAALSPPAILGDAGVEKWNDIAPLLSRMGVLTQADLGSLERYCLMHEQWIVIVKHVQQHGMTRDNTDGGRSTSAEGLLFKSLPRELLAIERQFGLTPAARSSMKVENAPSAQDPLEAYLQERIA